MRMPRRDQGTEVETRDLCPVKSDGNERKPGPTTKELVDDRTLGLDPGDEREGTQEGSNVSGEPVPDE
ncbi:hypothetical protein GCM10025794_32830 [Massilia kyonggiensis]